MLTLIIIVIIWAVYRISKDSSDQIKIDTLLATEIVDLKAELEQLKQRIDYLENK